MFRVCCSSMLRVYERVFGSISLLFVYMCVRIPSSPGSICFVCLFVSWNKNPKNYTPLRECPRAGHFRASLLLHTTCVRS